MQKAPLSVETHEETSRVQRLPYCDQIGLLPNIVCVSPDISQENKDVFHKRNVEVFPVDVSLGVVIQFFDVLRPLDCEPKKLDI